MKAEDWLATIFLMKMTLHQIVYLKMRLRMADGRWTFTHLRAFLQMMSLQGTEISRVHIPFHIDVFIQKISATSFKEGSEPDKIVSGVTRQVGEESNCWESDGISKDGESLEIKLNEAEKLSQIRIVFDSNLTRELIVTMIKRVQNKQVEHLPLELVKSFTVTAFLGDEVCFEKTYDENNKRLFVINTDENVVADKVVIKIHSTYGYENAKVYEGRLY